MGLPKKIRTAIHPNGKKKQDKSLETRKYTSTFPIQRYFMAVKVLEFLKFFLQMVGVYSSFPLQGILLIVSLVVQIEIDSITANCQTIHPTETFVLVNNFFKLPVPGIEPLTIGMQGQLSIHSTMGTPQNFNLVDKRIFWNTMRSRNRTGAMRHQPLLYSQLILSYHKL